MTAEDGHHGDMYSQGDVEADSGGIDAAPVYDPISDAYTTTFDASGTDASVAVAEALASVRRCSVVDLDPLYESFDPDALDILIRNGNQAVTVTIGIDDFDVVVTGHGHLEITPP